MDPWSRISSAGLLVATLIGCGAANANSAALQYDTRHLTVAVYNQAGVDAATVAYAERVTSETYRNVGIEITWVEAGGYDDADRFYVTLLANDALAPYPVQKEAVGFATPGSLGANAIYDRIRAIARRYRVSCGLVLGYVMAHELGHLLLPAHSHSNSGLMRADMDITQAAARNLRFTNDQRVLMQERLMVWPVVSTH